MKRHKTSNSSVGITALGVLKPFGLDITPQTADIGRSSNSEPDHVGQPSRWQITIGKTIGTAVRLVGGTLCEPPLVGDRASEQRFQNHGPGLCSDINLLRLRRLKAPRPLP